MAAKMRRNFAGALSARELPDGTWRIGPRGRGGRPEVQIIVIGASAGSIEDCGSALHGLDIEWHGRRALLTTMSAGRVAKLDARAAIIHEPLPDLHAALPLARFDARARRFWRRVFMLVRIPGGRRLLGMLARASRKRR